MAVLSEVSIRAAPADTAREALTSAEFGAGLRFGLLALVVGAIVGIVWRRQAQFPAPVAGLLIAGAGWLALRDELGLPDRLGIVLGALAVGGLIDDLLDAPRGVRLLLPVPGAWMLAAGVDSPGAGWVGPAAGVAVAVGAALAADLDRRYRKEALGPPLLAIATAGVYLTVPDTEHALVMIAVLLAIAPLGWPMRLARLGSAGAFTAVGLLFWVVTVDGVGRDGAIVGSLACLGVLLAEPVAAALWPRAARAFDALGHSWSSGVLAGGIQVGVVLFASRVAGAPSGALPAAVLAGAGLVTVIIVMVVLCRVAEQRSTAQRPAARG